MTNSQLLGTYCFGIQVKERTLTTNLRVADHWSYLYIWLFISLQESPWIHNIKERFMGLCPTLTSFKREETIVLLAV